MCRHIFSYHRVTPVKQTVLGPITINSNTTLKFYSKDNLGNTETVKTQTYTFIAGYTELTLELTTPTIDQGGSLTAWGRLHNMSFERCRPDRRNNHAAHNRTQ